MRLNIETGRIDQSDWLASPNFDVRPNPLFINALIIHAISLPPNKFGESFVEDFFCNRLDHSKHPYFETIQSLRVSAHFYIKRTGDIIQFVSTLDRAWHAGASCLNGMHCVNDFSIGIELEGSDEFAFENEQYMALRQLSHTLCCAYPAISAERIVGHSDIAPNRKTDPGPCFDWLRYKNDIDGFLNADVNDPSNKKGT